MVYFVNKTAVVLFVDGTIPHLKIGSRLTMTITPGRSGDFYVTTAIEDLLDVTVKKRVRRSFKKRTNIL
jgi:hypothetical protein